MPQFGMTDDEMMRVLRDLADREGDDPDAGWYTVPEMCELVGKGSAPVRNMLKLAKRAGILESRRVKRETIDGRMLLVPAYRLTGDA